MADEIDDYPPTMRLLALFGLFVVGAVAFILLDVATGGKLTGSDCPDCQEASGA